MKIFDLTEVQLNFESLIDAASKGESFMISKSGTPLVKVVSLSESSDIKKNRLGFLNGQINVLDDFDSM